MSIEHERALVGEAILLVDQHNLVDVDPGDFCDSELSEIWAFIRNESNVDAIELGRKFGDELIGSLVHSLPASVKIKDVAAKVRESAHRRRCMEACKVVYRRLESGDNIGDVALYLNSQFDSVSKSEEAKPLFNFMIDAYKNVELSKEDKTHNFVPTGFRDFDSKYGGLPKEGLVIVAGRPSMGKTAFAFRVARNTSKTKPVLGFSMEMSGQSLAMRFMAQETNVDLQNLMRGEMLSDDWRKLSESVELLKKAKMWINDSANNSIGDICAEVRRFHRKHGEIGLVVIDYLTLIDLGEGQNQNDRISRATRSLKTLAMDVKCPVIVLSQLNRGVEQRANKKPLMSDLRDSGAIEQDADVILFPYREEVYVKNPNVEGLAELIVAKCRNGEAGTSIRLSWIARSAKFADLA